LFRENEGAFVRPKTSLQSKLPGGQAGRAFRPMQAGWP
jgi:hypothetical protein